MIKIKDNIKVVELFAGIGSQTQALKNLGVMHEVVARSEIDKYANISYEALHGNVENLGDITKIPELPTADLWTYSFPCTDISLAGKLAGLEKGGGTRSGLLWEVERLLLIAQENGTLPKYLLLENVKNLVGKKFRADYDKWLAFLSALGYSNYWQVLNAKNYGVPQNRERVFCVSVRGEHAPFVFPEKQELKTRLKDILESEVDEKFYITEARVRAMLASTYVQRRNSVISQEAIVPTLAARDWKEPKCVVLGELQNEKYQKMMESSRRVYDTNGIAPTVHTCGGGNTEPKVAERFHAQVIEVFEENNCESGDSIDAFNKKLNKSGISPTITTRPEGFKTAILPVVEEPIIAAMRGRNPENPSSRIVGEPTEQRLEFNKDGTANTITTVQKDNLLVCEERRDEGLRTFKDDCCGSLRCKESGGDKRVVEIKANTKKGYEEVAEGDSLNLAYENSKTRRGRVGKEMAQTVTCNDSQGVVEIAGVYTDATEKFQRPPLEGLSRTLKSGCHDAGIVEDSENVLRVRKLTPRECLRLMGWKDQEIDKIKAAGISNTQMYKQAGNGIVVQVLEEIFRSLYC
ncbi:MAG: DNA (cytosine-5-)-methyltransferase [Bacillota bacterium]